MDTNIPVLPVLAMPTEPSEDASKMDALVDADISRSENNIITWMTYLPADCVKTMIAMGWDVTT
jgi:hypothetical protein